MKNLELVARLQSARTALLTAQDHIEAVRTLTRDLEGDFNDLIFWPATVPTPDRQATELSGWLDRVERFLRAQEGSAAR